MGFEPETVTLQLDQIVPLKLLAPTARSGHKFKQIVASIQEVGLIESPVVMPDHDKKDRYLMLDGHLRLEALKELGIAEVDCLISTDDEAYTYNRYINRLSTIQEHRMIASAVARGVPEEKIAKALDLDVQSIVRKRQLLVGICPEAVELLKDRMVGAEAFPMLRRMKPMRQIEAATIMNDACSYSTNFMRTILAATPRDQLVDPANPKKIKGLDDEQMGRMENEMGTIQREYRLIEESFATDVLNLTIAKAYLVTLLANARVVRYLAQHYPEFLSQFQQIADMTTLSAKAPA